MRFNNTSRLALPLLLAVTLTSAFAQQPSDETVILWNNAAVEAAHSKKAGGLEMERALAIMHTAMFNAWAAYDRVALPTVGYPLRRPETERTVQNKREAISYAAYTVLTDLFPSEKASLVSRMLSLGYDPGADPQDPAAPGRIGVLAASALLQERHHDGSNQLGDMHPGAYSDYTGYVPANSPGAIRDADRWQPLVTAQDGSPAQAFYMPHWGQIKAFGFDSVLEVRPHAAPKSLKSDRAGYIRQAGEIVELSNNLTEREKVIAEYWELSQGAGTNYILWNQFAQFVSQRDRYPLDEQVKLFFVLNTAMLDASIAAWDAKRYWDSERPQTAIVALARILPGSRFREDWQSYLPTPPFPDFVSSHSVLSASAAEALRRFTGSDRFGGSYRRAAGVSELEGKPGPLHDVVLSWPTFSEAADESGMSRRYAGLHFEDADVEGRALGRRVASLSWEKAESYMLGVAGLSGTFAAAP
jgi:hypothetical protein